MTSLILTPCGVRIAKFKILFLKTFEIFICIHLLDDKLKQTAEALTTN